MIDQVKGIVPTGVKKLVKRNLERVIKPSGNRVFCLSMQRTGTTSVGKFLSDHGYRVANWGDSNHYNWPYLHSIGDYESIFNSNRFNSYNAFEDAPWFYDDIYRMLFHRFPKSKFILLKRDSNDWFDSMYRHSKGRTLGNTYRHCKVYNRLSEFYELLDSEPDFKPTENEIDNLMSLEGKREHYVRVYDEYYRDVKEYFFKYDKNRLFTGALEDPGKWEKIGTFLGFNVSDQYEMHSNKSKQNS